MRERSMRKPWRSSGLTFFLLWSALLFLTACRAAAPVQPATLMDKPLPGFALSELHVEEATVDNWTMRGRITLLNFFGSWCVECKDERKVLQKIAHSPNIQLVGIDWLDSRSTAIAWLGDFGYAYHRVGFDDDGEVAAMLGVENAPTTFIVDFRGHIRYKHVGPITSKVYAETIKQIIARIAQEEYPD